MGCFNATCAISSLPIRAGDPVLCFLVVRSPFQHESISTIDGEWAPRTWPIAARYDDYGSIQDWDVSTISQSWLSLLQEDIVEKAQGDNRYHEIPVSRSMSFEQLLDVLREGRLEVYTTEDPLLTRQGTRVRKTAVDMALVRRDVWVKLLCVPGDGKSLVDLNYLARVEWTKAKQKKIPGRDNLFSRSAYPSVTGLGEHFRFLANLDLDPSQEEQILSAAAEFAYVADLLAHIRHTWRKPSWSGGQRCQWSLHARVSRVMTGICETMILEEELEKSASIGGNNG